MSSSIAQVGKLRHKEVPVKNCEGSEVLPCLQVNKLASHRCYSRRQEPPGSATNDFITHVPLPSGPTGAMWSHPTERYTQWGFVPYEETSSLIRGCWHNGPAFAPEGDIIVIILVRRQICLPPQRETLFVSSKTVCYTDILEEIVQKKTWYKMCRNAMESCFSRVTSLVCCYLASKFPNRDFSRFG